MVTVKVFFELSEKGRKDALKKGLPANKTQELTGEFEDTILDDEICRVNSDGTTEIKCKSIEGYRIFFDEYPMSAQDAVDMTKFHQEMERLK